LTGGLPERQLFPGAASLALSACALWPPVNVVRLVYGLGLVVALDGSLGFNGVSFRWLREWVPPFRGLRVPARFALIVSFTLAVLAGFGTASLLNRWPRWDIPLASVLVAVAALELLPRLEFETVWARPPDIYRSLSQESPSVLAEFPVATGTWGIHSDPRYMYFSTFHWQRLVNGNSGFLPPSYEEFLIRSRRFPSNNSIEFLKTRGVEYIALHGEFMSANRFRRAIRDLGRRKDVELVARKQWQTAESRLYRLRRSE
jgi:hypothetical protein